MNRSCLIALILMAYAADAVGQGADSIDVRVFGGAGWDGCTDIWVDMAGCVVAGETTSDIAMAAGQAAWAPGGPVGRKGFVMALDSALDHVWSFAFAGDPDAPLGAPSSLAVRSVARTPDSTAWVLYDAPRDGHWMGHLMGVHPSSGVVGEFALSGGGSASTCAMVPAGGNSFLVVGNHWSQAVPSGVPSGIAVGLWPGTASVAPGWAPIPGGEGMEALDAAWWNDTLYIAVHRPGVPEAPAAIVLVAADNGNPVLVGMAPIADPDLVLNGITAGPLGVAWSGTLQSPDGTLDAVYGKLAAGPEPLEPAVWSQAWIAPTEAPNDRPGRAILWTGTILQCAARTTDAGAGGAGGMVQRRSGETGAWFGVHTFGGAGDEDIQALGVDGQGRLYIAGSSNSWTHLTTGNGSADAVLFRSPTTELVPDLPYAQPVAAIDVAATFVGISETPSQSANEKQKVYCLHSGMVLPASPDVDWTLYDMAGRVVVRGSGPAGAPDRTGWFRLLLSGPTGEEALWLWVVK